MNIEELQAALKVENASEEDYPKDIWVETAYRGKRLWQAVVACS